MADECELPATAVLVNGERRQVRTEPDTPLLYALRNHLGLTGSRFGCGLGLCGACDALAGIRLLYEKTQLLAPEREDRLRLFAERARRRLPLFDDEPEE